MELYFKDNFLNAGIGDIMNETGGKIGSLDLKGAFGSSLDVYDVGGAKLFSGKFNWGKWEVTAADGRSVGMLRARLSFFSKRFTYDAVGSGMFEITSPALSKDYNIERSSGGTVATFARTNNWMMPGAYCLNTLTNDLDIYELVAVVMGVNAIRKRQQSSSNSGA
ncbi:hypothetical protein EJP82_19655 [Paenibacillus anaericanus]|uniref:Uncharacterized protein n=1 Tax=Paenibacillus anaericanus TaxID=170367 RepID=A0A433Y5B6_9BACL|nr:hypothetical protein [Paenibacillus anaericanus]RUT43756.1 hypothetical protein EJP82_19655 [Paenibacillus anaericanus]